MSTQPVKPTVPVPTQQLAQELATALTNISNARNASAILTYKQAVVLYSKIYGVTPSPTAPPPPKPPEIEAVNTSLVIALEMANDTVDSDWLNIYTYTTYPVYTVPVPPVILPTQVVQPFGEGFPNFFELSPDSPSIPVGQVVTIKGVIYTKEVVGQNPFAPNGQITAWKQS